MPASKRSANRRFLSTSWMCGSTVTYLQILNADSALHPPAGQLIVLWHTFLHVPATHPASQNPAASVESVEPTYRGLGACFL